MAVVQTVHPLRAIAMDHTARPAVAIVCSLIVRLSAANAQPGVRDAASTPEQTMHLAIAAGTRGPYQVTATAAVGSEGQQINGPLSAPM